MNDTALISRLNELPRLKQVLQELLGMDNNNNIDFGSLSEKMAQDQVLSARLLRMANSVHFGATKNISSINDAIIRVGSGAVRTLVVASVVSGAFPKLETLNIKTYWSNTFEIASIASKIGSKAGLDPSSVFTTGVLHNIGELMIHSLLPTEAVAIEKRVEAGEERFDVQREVLGSSSAELGAKLAKAWKFPDEMVDAIANYDAPSQATTSPKLASTINFARDIHLIWDDFKTKEDKEQFITGHTYAKTLNISTPFVDIIDKVRGNGRELAEKLG
jgi:HD-like signal output (HDOD) protein